jgi:flagellar hook-associated protein 3 FlgL
MRIVTANAYDTAIANLQKRQQDLSETQTQLTSGKRVNRASDDPTAAARAERALAGIARSDANKRALDASANVMGIAESALGDAVELMQSARETLVAAGNGSYSDGERKALAFKLREIRNQLLNVANRPDGGGGYVFGGQGSSMPPFVDNTTGVGFAAQGGELLASSSEKLNLSVDGEQIFLKSKSGNGIFTTGPLAGSNSGKSWITSGNVTDPASLPYPSSGTSPTYELRFTTAGSTRTYDVVDTSTLPETPLSTGNAFTSGKAIQLTGLGISVTVSGEPANGDVFAIGESTNDQSVFKTLDDTIAALSQTNTLGPAVQQAMNTGLTGLDSVLNNLQGARSAVGESLNRMDGIESRISALKLAATQERSNAEDLDFTEAISRFQGQKTGYEVALQSYAAVQKLSLFNYING